MVLTPGMGYMCTAGPYAGLPQRCIGPLKSRGITSREEAAAFIVRNPLEWAEGFRNIGPKSRQAIEEWAANEIAALTSSTGKPLNRWRAIPRIAEAMREARDENPRGDLYRTLPPETLLNMLEQNMHEVRLAIEHDNDVRGKCADVANYASFILDNYEDPEGRPAPQEHAFQSLVAGPGRPTLRWCNTCGCLKRETRRFTYAEATVTYCPPGGQWTEKPPECRSR